jgi:lysozyme family protein
MAPPSPFEKAYKFVRKWEGGDSGPRSGDPNPTSRGITQAFYDDLAIRHGWRQQPVFDLTDDMVREAYLALWQETLCPTLPDPVGRCHFDGVVNMGEGRAVKLLQAAVGVGVDGSFGRKTADAVAAAVKANGGKAVALGILGLRRRFYRDLAASKPDKARFLKGWLNRVDDLEKAIT